MFMKRFLGMVLVVIMLVSSTTAFAREYIQDINNYTDTRTWYLAFEGEDENTPFDHNSNGYYTYTEEFLFGNGGFDHTDGIGEEVSVGMVWSMVSDNDDNIWFIDQDISYNGTGNKQRNFTGIGETFYHEKATYKNQLLRKYDSSTGEVTTVKDLNTIRIRYTDDKGKRHDLKGLRAYKLVNNPHNGKVYMSGKFTQDGDESIFMGVMFEVSPNFKAIIGNYAYDRIAGLDDLLITNENGDFIYSYRVWNDYNVLTIGEGWEMAEDTKTNKSYRYNGASKYYAQGAGRLEWDDYVEAIAKEDMLHIIRYNPVNGKITLARHDMNTGKWFNKVKVYIGDNRSVLATDDGFIIYKDGGYAKVRLDSTLECLTDSSNYTVVGEKLTPKLMTELSDGSLVIYDERKAKFNKITREGEAPVVEEEVIEEVEVETEYVDFSW
jgi:hypothetical protein